MRWATSPSRETSAYRTRGALDRLGLGAARAGLGGDSPGAGRRRHPPRRHRRPGDPGPASLRRGADPGPGRHSGGGRQLRGHRPQAALAGGSALGCGRLLHGGARPAVPRHLGGRQLERGAGRRAGRGGPRDPRGGGRLDRRGGRLREHRGHRREQAGGLGRRDLDCARRSPPRLGLRRGARRRGQLGGRRQPGRGRGTAHPRRHRAPGRGGALGAHGRRPEQRLVPRRRHDPGRARRDAVRGRLLPPRRRRRGDPLHRALERRALGRRRGPPPAHPPLVRPLDLRRRVAPGHRRDGQPAAAVFGRPALPRRRLRRRERHARGRHRRARGRRVESRGTGWGGTR